VSPASYNCPVREGEEVLNAGLVISVDIEQKEGNILHIQALVLRTSGITNPSLLSGNWDRPQEGVTPASLQRKICGV